MQSSCTHSTPPSVPNNWLKELEANFLKVFGEDSSEGSSKACMDQPEASSSDPTLDQLADELTELFGELSPTTQKARQRELVFSELISYLERAVELVGKLKRQDKPSTSTSLNLRSQIADLQKLVREINTLLTHLSQIKGA